MRKSKPSKRDAELLELITRTDGLEELLNLMARRLTVPDRRKPKRKNVKTDRHPPALAVKILPGIPD